MAVIVLSYSYSFPCSSLFLHWNKITRNTSISSSKVRRILLQILATHVLQTQETDLRAFTRQPSYCRPTPAATLLVELPHGAATLEHNPLPVTNPSRILIDGPRPGQPHNLRCPILVFFHFAQGRKVRSAGSGTIAQYPSRPGIDRRFARLISSLFQEWYQRRPTRTP